MSPRSDRSDLDSSSLQLQSPATNVYRVSNDGRNTQTPLRPGTEPQQVCAREVAPLSDSHPSDGCERQAPMVEELKDVLHCIRREVLTRTIENVEQSLTQRAREQQERTIEQLSAQLLREQARLSAFATPGTLIVLPRCVVT